MSKKENMSSWDPYNVICSPQIFKSSEYEYDAMWFDQTVIVSMWSSIIVNTFRLAFREP